MAATTEEYAEALTVLFNAIEADNGHISMARDGRIKIFHPTDPGVSDDAVPPPVVVSREYGPYNPGKMRWSVEP